MAWLSWREATEQALYGPEGFFRRESPAAHFRTAVHAAPDLMATAFLRLAVAVGARVIVDMGAGGGELLADLAIAAPDAGWGTVELVGVDVAAPPPSLPAQIAWLEQLPEGLDRALVIANEWLDNVPLDVAEVDEQGTARVVAVDPATGEERLGDPVSGSDAAWMAQWWPVEGAELGTRVEIGRPRDEAWASVLSGIESGLAVAIDYAHSRDARPPAGTLTGYRSGRMVHPVPDGTCDLTSHVALDACAAAGRAAGATDTLLISQREALGALGITGALPSRDLALRDPGAYLAAVGAASLAAELIAPGGLGDFAWLAQAKSVAIPDLLRGR